MKRIFILYICLICWVIDFLAQKIFAKRFLNCILSHRVRAGVNPRPNLRIPHMPLEALLLILVSAFLQAALNLLIKGSERKVAFVAGASLISLILYLPLFIWGRNLLGEQGFPNSLWLWLGILTCGGTGMAYYLFIGNAYDRGDLSLVFPVTRSFGPIFILIFALILLNEKVSYLGLLGILITIFGSYVIHLPSFRLSHLSLPFKAFKSKAFLFSMCAGACTATYSLINKKNLEAVEPFTLYYLIIGCITLFLVMSLLIRKKTNQIKDEIKHNLKNLFLMGFFGFISAALFLYALQMGKVSYLGSARNISIVFGVILGSLFLQEGYGKIRFFASLLILAGIFLLSLN
ncbi:MAG: EamA family transporter [candidate division Zixibacteria bacterium]|nr:EamA family transporter [candidate division Zixibacteria bacterium]